HRADGFQRAAPASNRRSCQTLGLMITPIQPQGERPTWRQLLKAHREPIRAWLQQSGTARTNFNAVAQQLSDFLIARIEQATTENPEAPIDRPRPRSLAVCLAEAPFVFKARLSLPSKGRPTSGLAGCRPPPAFSIHAL